MKVTTLSTAMAILSATNMVAAAPAPQVLTVWQTATQVVNTDGSIYDQEATKATVAAVSTSAAASTATSAAGTNSGSSSSGSKFNLDSLLSGGSGRMKQWLSKMFGDNSGSSSESSSAPANAPSTSTSITTSASTGSSGLGFLDSLLGGSDSDSDSDSGSVSGSDSGSGSGSGTSSTYKPSTLSTSTVSSSGSSGTSTSGSSSGIYDQISDSPGIDKTFAKEILDAHNTDRAKHLAQALSWDTDAYNYAKKVADNYDCSGVLTHTHGQFGENLACGYKDGPSAVQAWYEEGQTYDYSTANEYNHFTQMVWKDTTKVGCAYKDCSSENWGLYIICSYDPAGNVIGHNKANVLED